MAVALALLSAMPASAQAEDTLRQILNKGVVIHGELNARPIEMSVSYNPDGTSITNIVGAGGRPVELAGKWRLDGGKLCTVNALNPTENCFEIPAGTHPGEAFKVTTPAMGEVTITINN